MQTFDPFGTAKRCRGAPLCLPAVGRGSRSFDKLRRRPRRAAPTQLNQEAKKEYNEKRGLKKKLLKYFLTKVEFTDNETDLMNHLKSTVKVYR